MNDRRCRYCRQAFQPNRYHPQQQVCGRRSLPIRCISRSAWRVRRNGAGRTRPTGRNIARTIQSRWNETVENSACGTKNGAWRILQTTTWLSAKWRVFNRLPLLGRCLRLLANNIFLVSPLALGYKPARCCQSSSSRTSGYRYCGMVLLGPYWNGSRKLYRRQGTPGIQFVYTFEGRNTSFIGPIGTAYRCVS